MRKQDIVENLKLMHGLRMGGEPSTAWVAETRDSLLARATADADVSKARPSYRNAMDVFGFRDVFGAAFRYGGAMVATVLIILGSGSVGASAMYESVPGDTLYSLKRVTERAQVALTPSADARARLQVDLMGRRVEEIAKIADKPASGQSVRIAVAVSELREEAKNIEHEMANIRKDSPSTAVELAKYIDKKADLYHVTLKTQKSGFDASFAPSDDGIAEARNIVVDASVKAVAVIIESHASGSVLLTQWEVATTVGDKIKAVSDRVDTIEGGLSTSTPDSVKESANQAKVALDAAKELVLQSDLAGALVKVIEGKELVRAAETIVTASNEALLAVANATGTAPEAVPQVQAGVVMTGLATSSFPFTVTSTPSSEEASGPAIQETSAP